MDQNTALPSTNSPVSPVSNSDSSWELESLINRALKRTKERFVTYLLMTVATIGVFLGVVLICVLAGLLVGVVAAVTKMAALGLLLGLAIGLVGGAVAFYFFYWFQLASLYVITAQPKETFSQSLQTVKPWVGGFFWLMVVNVLFMLGLFPFFGLTLFILAIVWSIWSMFTVFVYLEFRKKGLANVWMSKTLVSQKFWGIFGRIALIEVLIFLMSWLLSFVGKAASISPLTSVLSFLLSLFTGPFVASFLYEMYLNTRRDVEVKPQTGWVVLSLIGFVLTVILLVLMGASLVKALPLIQQQLQNKMMPSNSNNTIQINQRLQNLQEGTSADEATSTQEELLQQQQIMNQQKNIINNLQQRGVVPTVTENDLQQ